MRISVQTTGRGLTEITRQVVAAVHERNYRDALCTLFVQHTSASLVIQENADPTARRDLERWLERLVPDGDPFYSHTTEGPDDMPSHVKSALTSTSISIPVVDGRLGLGTWQGVFLWEHKLRGSERHILVHVA